MGFARARRLRAAATAATVAALATALTAPPAHADRYSIVNGCYAVQSPSGATLTPAAQVRLQATDLGSYLLYRADRTFVAAHSDATAGIDQQPSPATDWVVTDGPNATFALSPKSNPGQTLTIAADGTGHLADRAAAGDAANLRLVPAQGCATYPEAELDATGTPFRGATPFGTVSGWMDGHLHWMNFELLGGGFKCGSPWSAYGIPYALPDCSSVEGPNGSAAPIQNFLDYGNPAQPSDTTGWPTLASWSRATIGNSHEGSYWRWMERAWMSGMRLMVMPVNDNRVLCVLYARSTHPCDEMATVTRALDDMRALQRYVDAQMGGPGKGFFQIVTDPFEARRVINQGRMAVVLEIEISELFDCQGYEQNSNCTRADVDRNLASVYSRGVRSMLLLNKFDNPLTGVRFDSGPIGVLINAGNRESAGSYWSAQTCTGPLHDNEIETGSPQANALASQVTSTLGLPGGTAPAYPPAPHCNTRGLTELGSYLVNRMIDHGMIVNPDHMSQKAVDQTLTIAESRRYSGVISPHGWMDPGNWPRVWKLGGIVRYAAGDATNYVKDWKQYRPVSSPYLLGSPMGTDIAGLFAQPGPSSDAAKVMSYPFRSVAGDVTFTQQHTGSRTFDYRTEGIAHYGLYADWLRDVQLHAPPQLITDFMQSAEAYLQMWERAEGVHGPACLPGDMTLRAGGLGQMRLGANADDLLRATGQPQVRTSSWSWCVDGAGSAGPAATAVLTRAGNVALVASTGPDHDAADIVPGDSARRLRRRTRSIGAGLYVRPASRGATFVYRVAGKRILMVAVTTRAVAANRRLLLGYLGQVRPAVARPAPFAFNPAAVSGIEPRNVPPALLGVPAAQVHNLVLLCSLLHG